MCVSYHAWIVCVLLCACLCHQDLNDPFSWRLRNSGRCMSFFLAMTVVGDLERHLPKHTGERRFTCTICPRTFTRLQYLREHVNVHLGHRPYECSSCGMSFHDLASCHRHVQKHKQVLELQTSQQQLDQGQDKSEQQLGSKVNVFCCFYVYLGHQVCKIPILDFHRFLAYIYARILGMGTKVLKKNLLKCVGSFVLSY